MTQIQIQQEFNELKKLLKDNFINSKPVLSATETATYLNISYSRLTKLTSAMLIPFYKPTNGILFFFREDLHTWIKESKVYNDDDVDKLLKQHYKDKKA